jgi:hypothetical protein
VTFICIGSTSRTFPACRSPRRPPTAWYPTRPTLWPRGSFRKTRSTGRSTDISSQKKSSRISQHHEKNRKTSGIQGNEKPVSILTLRTHHSILPQSFSLAIRPRCPKRTFPIPAARRLGVTYRSSSCRIDIHRMQGKVSEYWEEETGWSRCIRYVRKDRVFLATSKS